MRVLELLEEIEEIVDTAAGFPLTGKIMIDSEELLEIVREIRSELPDEIQQAQWIKNERERIMTEAKNQYEQIIADAQKQAESVQKLLLAAFDPGGEWDIVRQDAGTMILANEVDPSSVRYLMPRIRLPKRNPRDPREPERWDYAPVFRAEEYVTFNFRDERTGKLRVTVRHDVVANPGTRGEVTVKSDCDNHGRLMRYCSTFMNGGFGGGFDTCYRNGHMYISDVFDGSAADRVGVREGDRVRLINKTVADEVSLEQFAKKYQWAELGKPFTMDLERPNGERYHVELAVDYIPARAERCKSFSEARQVLKPNGRVPIWPMRQWRRPFTTRQVAANFTMSALTNGS